MQEGLACSEICSLPRSYYLALKDLLGPPFDFNQNCEWSPNIVESSLIPSPFISLMPGSSPRCFAFAEQRDEVYGVGFPLNQSGGGHCVRTIYLLGPENWFLTGKNHSGNLTPERWLWHSRGVFIPADTSTKSNGRSNFSRDLQAQCSREVRSDLHDLWRSPSSCSQSHS